MKTIAISNRKGGSCKTTLTITVGAALAALGHNVVLIDCDTQGSLSGLLGMTDDLGRIDEKLHLVLKRELDINAALRAVDGGKIPAAPNAQPGQLRLLPGALATDSAVRAIQDDPVRFSIANTLTVLSRPLSDLTGDVDYVLIDLGPSHPLLTAAVYVACDWILIPTLTDFLSLTAVVEVVTTMRVYQQEKSDLEILGIVPTLTRRGTINHDAGMSVLHENFEAYLLDDIPYRTIWAQAAWENQTVLTYAPQDVASDEAWRLTRALLDRLEA